MGLGNGMLNMKNMNSNSEFVFKSACRVSRQQSLFGGVSEVWRLWLRRATFVTRGLLQYSLGVVELFDGENQHHYGQRHNGYEGCREHGSAKARGAVFGERGGHTMNRTILRSGATSASGVV